MPQSRTLSVGFDVHTASMAGAYLAPAPPAEGVSLGPIATRQGASATRLRRLPSHSPPLVLVSAAGPCGSWLSRSLPPNGQVCWGVAPALIPNKPGARVHTNRRDASTLARLRRSGDLPPGDGPARAAEAMRALGRARAEASRALQTAQWRLHALLLRPALRSTGRAPWGLAPRRWRRAVVCPPRRRRVGSKHPCERAPHPRHGWRGWHQS